MSSHQTYMIKPCARRPLAHTLTVALQATHIFETAKPTKIIWYICKLTQTL